MIVFDPNNRIVKLCARGMELEGQASEAGDLFMEAWNMATTDFERMIASHYVARQQKSVSDKLEWDLVALKHALNGSRGEVKGILPSLYLNIGKDYEDLSDVDEARKHYNLANSFTEFLPEDGYGNMIRNGIENGLVRTR